MKAYKNIITCPNSGLQKTLVTVNHDENRTEEVSTTVSQLHHIYLLDRSYSMGNLIGELIDNVQETLKTVSDDDLISIIWFSSAGSHGTLVKGATKSESLNTLLDSLRSVNGCTCFSEPVEEASKIVSELSVLCANISITLFTDGDPVVSWSVDEEIQRTSDIITGMKDDILAFNTIGYGPHYNQEILRSFSELSEFGEMTHSSNIHDFTRIFDKNFQRVSEMVFESAQIEANELPITYLSRNFTKQATGEMILSRLHSEKNQFFILGNDDADFEFSVNGETFSTADITTAARPATLRNYMYAAMYNNYYAGRRFEALQIAAIGVQDKGIVDSQNAAFTANEVADHLQLVQKAVFKPNSRYADGECDVDYIPANDALCVMDVLTDLSQSNSLYVPHGKHGSKYTRIGKKTVDNFNMFKRDAEEVRANFNDFVFASDFLNISIRFVVNGTVTLNPKQAARVGLTPEYRSHIFRTYTLIKDGTLNIPKVEAHLSQDLFDKYVDAGFVTKIGDSDVDGLVHVVLELDSLPVINRLYLEQSQSIETVLKTTNEILEYQARVKTATALLKEIEQQFPSASQTGEFRSMTEDQLEVLKEHGINSNGAYNGIGNKTETVGETDQYEVRTLRFDIKGCSALPSIKVALDRRKSGKKPTVSQKYMIEAIEEIEELFESQGIDFDIHVLQENLVEELKNYVQDCKYRLQFCRALQSTLKLAKVLTNDWFDGLEVDKKGKSYFEKDDCTMYVTADRVIRHVSVS